jgi:hypothetical protein
MTDAQQSIEADGSLLAGVDVQTLLDFLDHLPERFTPVVETDAADPIAYYVVNHLVTDELRAKVLVIEPEFADTLRKLARAFYACPPRAEVPA